MKRSVRLLALLLALITVSVSVAGCKGNDKSKNDDPNKAVSGKLGYELPYFEGIGDNPVVKIVTHDSNVFGKKQDSVGVFEAGYNGTVETTSVPFDDVTVKFINAVLAEDPYDISTQGLTTAAIRKGIISPWNELIDMSTTLWDDVRETNKVIASATAGKLYGIMPVNNKSTGVWFNKELFEEYGVKTPLEYDAEDNWNWNTMRDIAKKLTVDTDNDGVTDIYGLAFDCPWDMMTTAGIPYIGHKEDGTPYNNLASPDVARVMNFYQKLHTEDKVVGGGRNAFGQGKLGMWYAGWWFISVFREQAEAFTIDYAPQPKDPESDTWYVSPGGYQYALASNSKNKLAAAALMCSARYACAETWNDIRNGIIDDPNKPLSEEDKALPTELRHRYPLQQVDDRLVPFVGPSGYTYSIAHDMWRTGIIEGKPWSQVREEVSPKIDAAIADAIKD